MQIQPCGPLHGEITVPGDKSISHRAVMLGALANGTTHITGFLMGEDCLSTIDCFRKMGVSIDVSDKEVVVEGVGLHGLTAPECELYTGNSGTTTRLLSGILAGQSFTSTMNGDATIQRRPMGRVMKPLREMGASIEGKDDKEVFENFITKLEELKDFIGVKKTIADYGVDEQYFLDTLDEMTEQAFNDQCTGANPRYPLMSEIKELYLDAYYGREPQDYAVC